MESFQQEIVRKLSKISPLYLVGGAIRDGILNLPTKDLDGVINFPVEELEKVLQEWGLYPLRIGAKHPTISLFHKGERIDLIPFDGSLERDSQRRDFTINAIYQDTRTGEYIDPLGGVADLKNQLLKACGKPEERFQEDPIRVLRLVRFTVKYGLEIEQKTWEAAQNAVHLLADTAAERISEELGRIFVLEHPETSIRLLDELGYIDAFLPELARLKGLVQNRYHTKDAWEHTLHVFRNTPSRLMLRLAGLFHDLGKWETASRECYAWGRCTQENQEFLLEQFRLHGKQLHRWNGQYVEVHGARLDHYPDVIQVKHIKKSNSRKAGFEWVKDGKRHFLGHEKESRRLTQQILARYRFSMVLGNEDWGGEKELLWLIENHMSGTLAFMSELRGEGKPSELFHKIKRFAWEKGWDGHTYQMERLYALLDLWRADFFGGKQREPQDEEIFEKLQQKIREEAQNMRERVPEIQWQEFAEFVREHKISGREIGEFKDAIRKQLMVGKDFQTINKAFLDKEYKYFQAKRKRT